MITLRQIERLWNAREYNRLTRELLAFRVEDSARLRASLDGATAAAALGLIRLEELNQAYATIALKFVRCIIASQDSQGGWDSPALTSLCIRALLTSSGHGLVIDRGIAHLAELQKSDGSWPREAIRRLAPDSFTTAFVLFSLGSSTLFRNAVRIEQAVTSFAGERGMEMDAITRRLWSHAVTRANVRVARVNAQPSAAMLDGIAA